MFAQGQFLIDPNAPPEEIVRKRAALNKVMRAYGSANNVGEGVGDLMMGIGTGIQNRRVTQAERAQSESANSAFDSLFGGGEPAAPTVDAGGFPSAPSSPGFPPAPAAPSGTLTPPADIPNVPATNISGSKAEFVNALLPAAIEESKRTGIDPRIIVAQAAQETGWGRSAPGNNFFGIKSHGKGGGQNLTTHEVINGRRVKINDSFRTFASPADSVRGYGDFMLENPRYRPMREAGDLDSQLAALGASGYATDPDYANSVGSIARGIQLPQASTAMEAVNAMAQPQAPQEPIMDPLAYNQQNMRMSPDLAGEPMPVERAPLPMSQPQGQPPIPGIQPTATMDNMAGRMPAPEGQPMPQGREALAAALMQQQAPAPAQQAIEQTAPQQPEADLRAQFNSPQLDAADPTRGILKVLMERGGQPAQANPAVSRVQQAMQGQGGQQNIGTLIELANNPFLSEGKRAVIASMVERTMKAQDPEAQLDMEYKLAQLEKLKAPDAGFRRATPEEAAGFGAPAGQIGPDGRFYPVNPPSGTSLQVDPTTGAVTFQQGSGVKPLTEGQSKDTVYATRAAGSLPILDEFGGALTSAGQRAMDMDPTGIVRGQQSPEFQKAKQAGDEFLQAILRKDTGAAITTDEMNSYGRTYLPAPGDGPEVLAQKKVARLRALEAMKAGMPPQAILQQEKALANSALKAPVVIDGFTIEEIE